MAGREVSNDYRYGFQGQETDAEYFNGAVSFKYRVHDARLGRSLSLDPRAPDYPWNSTYAFSENRVIDGVELEGLEFVSLVAMNLDEKSVGVALEVLNEVKTFWVAAYHDDPDYWQGSDQGEDKWMGEDGFYEKGVPTMAATLSLISGAGALQAGTSVLARLTIAAAADDLTGLAADDGQSVMVELMEGLVGEQASNVVTSIKLVIDVKSFVKGKASFIAAGQDGEKLGVGVFEVFSTSTDITSITLKVTDWIPEEKESDESANDSKGSDEE